MSDKGNRISQVVENRQHIIKHCRGKMFTSESLKIVALICMLIDHAGATLFLQCDILRSIDEYHFRYMRSFWLKAVSIRIVWNGICLALEYLR